MNDLVFVHDSFEKLRTDLLRSELETCAILLANVAPKSEGARLLVKQAELPPEGAYVERTQYSAQLKPEYIAPLVKRAKIQRQALVFVHTHPGAISVPRFSPIDDRGEQVLEKFLKTREVAPPHAALVLGPDGCSARLLNSNMPVRVIQVGVNLDVIYDPIDSDADDPIFDRQVRAFGQQGQAILKKLTIGIVGLGGTGSVVAQQLAYLGVEKYLLVDPDTVEASNLNRLVGTTPADTGKSKVGIAERYIKSIRPDAKVIAVQGSVLDAKTARMLVDTDFFFCCTDSHGSRAVLNQLAYQYFLPCIDMGVSISSKKSTVTHITGRVQMLSPRLACLTCAGLLDADAIRYDLMSSYQRQTDPYFIGNGQPEPAVISLNSTMASLAVTMFLGAAIGIPSEARYQIYNGMTGKIRIITGITDQKCVVCSRLGALGRGDEWPLPARQT